MRDLSESELKEILIKLLNCKKYKYELAYAYDVAYMRLYGIESHLTATCDLSLKSTMLQNQYDLAKVIVNKLKPYNEIAKKGFMCKMKLSEKHNVFFNRIETKFSNKIFKI